MSSEVLAQESAHPGDTRTAPWWVKILVLFHVFCITVWACPKPGAEVVSGKIKPWGSDYIRFWNEKYLKGNPDLVNDQSWPGPVPRWLIQDVQDPIHLYLFTTGVWQYWDMFAPNPASWDWWGDAEVIFKDGSHLTYQYPRMFLLSIPQKYLKERFRKFYERAHDDQYKVLFAQFGLRVALLNYKNPKNPPVTVKLFRHWLVIADPGKPQAKDYSSYNYYTYEVDQQRLRELAVRKY